MFFYFREQLWCWQVDTRVQSIVIKMFILKILRILSTDVAQMRQMENDGKLTTVSLLTNQNYTQQSKNVTHLTVLKQENAGEENKMNRMVLSLSVILNE